MTDDNKSGSKKRLTLSLNRKVDPEKVKAKVEEKRKNMLNNNTKSDSLNNNLTNSELKIRLSAIEKDIKDKKQKEAELKIQQDKFTEKQEIVKEKEVKSDTPKNDVVQKDKEDNKKDENIKPQIKETNTTKESKKEKTVVKEEKNKDNSDKNKEPLKKSNEKDNRKSDYNIDFQEEKNIKKKKTQYTEKKAKKRKISINNIDDFDDENDVMKSVAATKRRNEKQKKKSLSEFSAPTEQQLLDQRANTEIQVSGNSISVKELSIKMSLNSKDVIKTLNKLGCTGLKKDNDIDLDIAELLVSDYGFKFKKIDDSDVENILNTDIKNAKMIQRSPIITIMGHVDHGKTSLLDYFRNSSVVDGEAGGITQHIGAYRVELKKGKVSATFLDTPGHEAFTAMRMRGTNITDIAIIVIAADDGVMEQTIESINHAKAANVQIMIVINKIDKEGANPDKIVNDLLQYDIVAEEFGGDIIISKVSVKNNIGLDKLKEMIILQSEIMDLQAVENCPVEGVVIESYLDKHRGVVTTLLIQKGCLKSGDFIIAGEAMGKVKLISNDRGQKLKEAHPSMPVEMLGLNNIPNAGEKFHFVNNEKIARNIINYRIRVKQDKKAEEEKLKKSNQFLLRMSGKDSKKELFIILKADVNGSLEAITSSLLKVNNDEVEIKIIHSGVGGINESDISLAKSSSAILLGFNVRANAAAKKIIEDESIQVIYHSIIYKLIDDINIIIGGMMAPEIHEKHIGNAVIRQVYSMSKVGNVAGCYVIDGIIKRGCGVRLLRDNVVIHEGKLKTLKRFKQEVESVTKNYECGMAFESYSDIKVDDVIECFEVIEKQKVL